mmetsp:Transcript_11191/g.12935  ORF Transcript_11191/g.12935 Transcript_11191/m.12935 type:complete len:140 (-) Transcript_11191:322-741(-)
MFNDDQLRTKNNEVYSRHGRSNNNQGALYEHALVQSRPLRHSLSSSSLLPVSLLFWQDQSLHWRCQVRSRSMNEVCCWKCSQQHSSMELSVSSTLNMAKACVATIASLHLPACELFVLFGCIFPAHLESKLEQSLVCER